MLNFILIHLVEDPVTRTKRLRPIQYPLYVNVGGEHDRFEAGLYDRSNTYGEIMPLRTRDHNTSPEGIRSFHVTLQKCFVLLVIIIFGKQSCRTLW